MSNDLSRLPGIWTAVRHLVCVLVGAPGPWHGGSAKATPIVASSATPNRTTVNNTVAFEHPVSFSILEFCIIAGPLVANGHCEGNGADCPRLSGDRPLEDERDHTADDEVR